jgi:hypothetical protein
LVPVETAASRQGLSDRRRAREVQRNVVGHQHDAQVVSRPGGSRDDIDDLGAAQGPSRAKSASNRRRRNHPNETIRGKAVEIETPSRTSEARAVEVNQEFLEAWALK